MLHAWLERGHPVAFRARLTTATEGGQEFEVAVTTTPEGALQCVREWLDDFVASEPEGGEAPLEHP